VLVGNSGNGVCQHGDVFKTPQIVLLCKNLVRTSTFYQQLGFEEVFRTPTEGSPIHVDLVLDGYRIGLASEASTRHDHGLDPVVTGQRAAVILWTDDTPTAYSRIQELGAVPVKEPEPWLGRLLIAWAEDPDGHLIQVVQSTD
jgi:catechol 2,3-dioxygenase-like lactoylglutathione lyase family enzyme